MFSTGRPWLHVLESLNDPAIIVDEQFLIVAWNQRAEALYDLSDKDVRGHRVREFVETELPAESAEAFESDLREKRAWRGRVRQRLPSGQWLVIESSIGAVLSPDGSILGWIAVNRDITAAEANARRLAASERRARCLMEFAQRAAAWPIGQVKPMDELAAVARDYFEDAVVVVRLGADGDTLSLAACVFPDPAHEQLIRPLFEAEPFRLGQGLAGRVVQTGEAIVLLSVDPDSFRAQFPAASHRDDLPPIFGAISWPLRTAQGLLGAVTLLRTRANDPYLPEDEAFVEALAHHAALVLEAERTLAEREVERAQLASTVQALDDFALMAAHDLRAPLQVIDAYVEVLRNEWSTLPDDERGGLLQRIGAASGRLRELLAALLALARVTREPLKRSRVELELMVREVFAELVELEPTRKLSLSYEGVPCVEADPELLRIVLQNLIGNAVKYTTGVDDARLKVVTRQEEGTWKMSVADNGAGFDAQFAHQLFQPFRRLHARSRFPGTGLGLTTVARIVARHGGEVSARGESGQGAEFSFTLRR
jgi:PAS domain S-box-containing protein